MEMYSIQKGKLIVHTLRHKSLLMKIIEGGFKGSIERTR